MKIKYLSDGSLISYLGSLEHNRILVLIGRDNVDQDNALFRDFISSIDLTQYTVVWYESTYIRLKTRMSDPVYYTSSTCVWKKRWVRLCACLTYGWIWMSTLPRYHRYSRSVDFRCQSLKRFLERFGLDQQVSLLTQSAGGRVASLVADDLAIYRLVCFGYPFRHPHAPDEPDRYLHLKDIRTPFLIIQGGDDPYGNWETVIRDYDVSSSVTIEYADTDHDFVLLSTQKEIVLTQVREFLNVMPYTMTCNG